MKPQEDIQPSNNIIAFPKGLVDIQKPEQLNKEQVDEHFDELKDYIIAEVMELIVPTLYNQLGMVGYSITQDNVKDAALMVESIKAFLYKTYDLNHPFHELAENMFHMDEKDNLTMVGNLSMIDISDKTISNN